MTKAIIPSKSSELQSDNDELALLFERDFVKIEKDLTALALFSATTTKIKAARSKVIDLYQMIDDKRTLVTVTVVPSALHGLPTTADQDKTLALFKIIQE